MITPENPTLVLRDVRKSFARDEALRGVSLEVGAGEVVALSGASGSGKSTLLHCATGLIRPESGSVLFHGRPVADMPERERSRLRRREVGLVLQFGQLAPELTAVQNVALPLLMDQHDRAAALTAATAWLRRLGAGDWADALPGELSGGQRQRIAVARALVTGPSLVCADEPTGALDSVAGEELMTALLEATRSSGASLLLVTHDNRVAARADREVVLRDGRVWEASVRA
jgi:putative ABC transport system ATP-binding protein